MRGSSDARRGGWLLLRLAMAEPNAEPSCDGAPREGGDRARAPCVCAELRLVLGPEVAGVPLADVPAGLGEPPGDERMEAARCRRAEAMFACGDTFATLTVGLSGEIWPLLSVDPTAEREDDTCSGDWERAGVFDSERMESVDGVLRRSVGCATSARLTIELVLTRAFSGADAAAAALMLELECWRVTFRQRCPGTDVPLAGTWSECGRGRCRLSPSPWPCRSRRRVPRHRVR